MLVHMRVGFHGVVVGQFHPIPALNLTEGELHVVVFVAP